MGARARGFLLFSFAFSSVLSSPEIAIPSSESTKLNATDVDSPSNSTSTSGTSVKVAIDRGCFREGICGRGVGSIDKREISYFPLGGSRGELRGAAAAEASSSLFDSARDEPGAGGGGLEKRARIGFTGMRGKKDSYLSDKYGGGRGGIDPEGFVDLLEKRTRMGFNGMRGKRLDGHTGKRTQMAFHGMRGKKSDDYDSYDDRRSDGGNDVNDEYDVYAVPVGTAEEWAAGAESPYDGWDKRSMAFHGMRGRRSGDYPFGSDLSGYDFKRAMGFLGMRGKKAPESWNLGDYGKRGYQSGFYGMKGKKAQSGFFGMRGKKSLPGLLGIQGEPLDNEVNTISTLNSVSTQERVRRATNWLRNSKKAKSAFFAVRGKKSSREENGSDLNLISSSE